MRALLLNPQPERDIVISRDHMGGFGFEIKSANMIPPLTLAYCAAVVEKDGFEAEIIDAVALRLPPSKVVERVKQRRFDIIAVNTATPSISDDLAMADALRQFSPDSTIALLGPHVSIFAEEALRASSAEMVIRGEPEYTMRELAQAVDAGKPIESISGITLKQDGKIRHNPDRPHINDLDSLPFPARHLLPMKKYQSTLWGKKPFTTMLTSRGCFYGCSYCPYRVAHGTKWRGRSAENVVAEIEDCVRRFGVREILFRDPLFTADAERSLHICKLIRERGLKVDWRCETRADLVTEGMIDSFASAGCKGINFGVESGSDTILEEIGRKRIEVDRLGSIFRRCRKAGIETMAFFIIGLPGETAATVKETVNLAIRLNPDAAQFTAATPYPQTPYYEQLKRDGLLKKDWSLYTSRASVVGTRELDPETLSHLVAKAYRSFYLRSSYFSMRMKKLKSFHEFTRAYKGLWSALRYSGLG